MPQSLVYRLLTVGIRESNNYHQTQTLALPINLENSILSPISYIRLIHLLSSVYEENIY